MFMALLSSSQSAYFQCNYYTGSWGSLGTLYQCGVQNSVSITSLDAAQVDYICGEHPAGYNNDNVEAFDVYRGQIHYFPRGLNKFFKNLKGIQIGSTGLKEVHQSDLKDLPKLMNLHLHTSNSEILEKNLFEFNPNLDYIYLNSNKISHIDPNIFDKLTILRKLYLNSNTCINMRADNPTEINNVIRTAQSQCSNSDYSNLELKVKNLEIESKNLNSENFKEKLENLENEIKNSKFPNFFQQKLQDLKADQVKKAQETTTQKPTTMTTTATTTTTEAPKKPEVNSFETCSALESKIDKIAANLMDILIQTGNRSNNEQSKDQFNENFSNLDKKFTKLSGTVAKVDENVANLKEVIMSFHKATSTNVKDEPAESSKMKTGIFKISEKIEKFDIKLEILEENLSNFKTFSYKKFDKMENEEKVFHTIIKKAMENTIEDVEMKIGEIEAKIDRKLDEIDGKFEEMERKFEEILKMVKNGE